MSAENQLFQAFRFSERTLFGREVEYKETGIPIADAQIRYLQKFGKAKAQVEGRIREIGGSKSPPSKDQ